MVSASVPSQSNMSPLICIKRSQESEFRSQNFCGVCREQFTGFFELRMQLGGVAVIQIFRQNQIVTAFFQGALRDVQESGFVRAPAFFESFRDVGWNGDRRATKLGGQPVSFMAWKLFRETINAQNQL